MVLKLIPWDEWKLNNDCFQRKTTIKNINFLPWYSRRYGTFGTYCKCTTYSSVWYSKHKWSTIDTEKPFCAYLIKSVTLLYVTVWHNFFFGINLPARTIMFWSVGIVIIIRPQPLQWGLKLLLGVFPLAEKTDGHVHFFALYSYIVHERRSDDLTSFSRFRCYTSQ